MSKLVHIENKKKPRKKGWHGQEIPPVAPEFLKKNDSDSLIIVNFRNYANELDRKHDKYERIIKLSRDITIESKRIIFLLHTIDRGTKIDGILKEAKARLDNLLVHQWRSVSVELGNEDLYLFHKAFSPGMQEFMEAYLFYDYLTNGKFPNWIHYQEKLNMETGVEIIKSEDSNDVLQSEPVKSLTMPILPMDYILGLADVTGELMKKCINNLGQGNVDDCFKTCNVVRDLYSGFLFTTISGNKEFSRKIYTLRQSLLKIEMVCYHVCVRGTEALNYMLDDVDLQNCQTDEDKSFF